MIEVFKTNVKYNIDAKRIIALLHAKLHEYRINFDLSDCDHILRIESKFEQVKVAEIKDTLLNEGFQCEELPY